MYTLQVREDTIHLVGFAVSFHLEHSVAGGTDEYVAILTFQQTGHIAWNGLLLLIVGGNSAETLTVKHLEGTIHANEKTAVSVLRHTVDVVAGHTEVLAPLFLKCAELITVVAVQSVTRGYPDKTVSVQIDLCGIAA